MSLTKKKVMKARSFNYDVDTGEDLEKSANRLIDEGYLKIKTEKYVKTEPYTGEQWITWNVGWRKSGNSRNVQARLWEDY